MEKVDHFEHLFWRWDKLRIPSEIKLHLKKHTCDAIKRKKKTEGSLKEHKKTAHESGGKIFKCELCEYSNISNRNLASHVKLRHEKDKFKYFCSVCGKKFATAYLVTNHERKVHFSKGQIISEWLLDVFSWTKKRTKIFLYFCPSL